jgi:predicted metal-dependent peptidase
METETDKVAGDRVRKARAELILSQVFYSVLVSNVDPKPSRAIPTMATDGRNHFYNPDFIAKLNQTQLLAVQAHESEHDARRHHSRRNGRDPAKWNEACDYAINIDLVDAGFQLPDWVLLDPKYRGMSAEDIYRTRELDQQKEEEAKKPPPPDDDQEEPQDGEDDQEQDDQTEDDSDTGDSDDEPEGDAQDDDADEGEGDQGGDDRSEDDDEACRECGAVPGTPEYGTVGDGFDGLCPSCADKAEPDETEGADEADGEGEPAKSSGDPGGMGEVLDAATDAADMAAADSQWETIFRQAAFLAEKRGTLPGHVTREIKRADNPPQDWRETLRAYFDQGSLKQETWNRPNRRFAGAGVYLPGLRRDGINLAVFLIDTSGSMDQVALVCIATEAQAALDDGVLDQVVVIYGDVRVTRVDNYRQGDEIEFDPRGGGDTDLKPLFKHVADEIEDASLIVCFTDMEIGDPGPEPACPVLFAATGYPDSVRRYLANAPWNAPGIDVGTH